MLTTDLQALFDRDLNKLQQEIEAYQHEPALWRVAPGISNSAGNLCLHLLGNLNTYIGAELGHSGYIRHRELEFSRKDVPRAELVQGIAATRRVVAATLAQLPNEQLSQEYPLLVLAAKTSTAFFLLHLATHLTYHLGQINYHRRLLDAGNRSAV
ncbi:MAG: DinB family protein [Bacteroidota bacterium]|nr:DinB family protein [Bacteroidota bacterium]